MVVNDVPGEECRIALLRDGRLEELYSETVAGVTNVGNIYKGRVVNVEPAIQAAFVDFGAGQNGFLHISDLHPRYFAGDDDKTERVGKKTPRRERPPIQQALKRGQSILVQVIKEGIGTKGPTLTSYISIPGRLMVMMPGMDRVGVSRKIEDHEQRREMRETLDSLDLPENIGFILRTAGFGRTKTDLKRDLAYLNRLWKQMEKRIETVQAPCPLYVESDLLIRTIRDILTSDIEAIVVDSESGYRRASEFLRVIAPRSAPQIVRFRRATPVFHAFDIETQIETIHRREVALPSGGAIVIEQTEALVAIDVNSGKSRSARDSETNAYQTNCEAADEICRQLRLRDLGGLVVNDLIDMNRSEHRREIEKRFRANLSQDRAKWMIGRISEFGVLEMTRQRMRPSMRKAHFSPCVACHGRGAVRTPESLASEALRFVAHLLQFERVRTVEIVCAKAVASSFLSSRRRKLVELEDRTGKRITVRVSETMAADQVDYYAYDDRNSDIEIAALPRVPPPTLAQLEREEVPQQGADDSTASPASKRKRRRRKLIATPEEAMRTVESEMGESPAGHDDDGESPEENEDEDAAPPKRKRRSRRRKKKGAAESGTEALAPAEEPPAPPTETKPVDEAVENDVQPGTGKKKRRRRRRKKVSGGSEPQVPAPLSGLAEPLEEKPRKKRRRRRKKPSGEQSQEESTAQAVKAEASSGPQPTGDGSVASKPRSLYGSRRKITKAAAKQARASDR